ncbi:MAG TPA: ubiquitin-like small modifier protein 1 [Gemmatimonadota bacterium]|nr:ubiquitin-like small modifier protein 1 [Gemmatimonadota bacterium]
MITVPVRLPTPLRPLADGRAEVEVPADTVGEALSTLVARYPTLRRHLYDEDGALRDYVNAFVNEDDVRVLDGSATKLAPGDRLTILPSIAGG